MIDLIKIIILRSLTTCFQVLCLTLLLCSSNIYAQNTNINLQDVDIRTLIKTVAQATGKNFIIDPRVKGKVTFVSGKGLDQDELYDTFLSILQVHNFSAVTSGDVIKIMPDVEAKQNPVPVIGGDKMGKSKRKRARDELVTRVIRIENVPAAQLVPILRPLIPNDGQLQAYGPSNTLLISDRAANIERILKVIKRMDREDDEQIEVVALKHATAEKLVKTMQALQKPGTNSAPGKTRISADNRTNSILVAGNKAARARVRDTIKKLDTPGGNDGDTRVIYLKYAKAADLVKVLQGLSNASTPTTAKALVTPTTNRNTATKVTTNTIATGQGTAIIASKSILADEGSNAIIITASPAGQKSMAQVIRQLDIRRAQVMVEAIIAEVSTDLSTEVGIQAALNGITSGNIGPIGLTNFNLLGGLTKSNPLGFGTGALLGIGYPDRFALVLKALSGDAATNILSTPTLVTMDNEEAEIVVGKNVPFVTGSFSNTGTGTNPTNPFQTIERKDVGLTLKITPQINKGSSIRLAIEQEVSSIAAASTGASDLITNKRSIKTNVMVEDGQILVLGGLMEDTFRDSQEKVPGLGDIPILGRLFRRDKTNKVKQSLMVFIHPVILRNPAIADAYTRRKYSHLQRQQARSNVLRRGVNKKHRAKAMPNIENVITQIPAKGQQRPLRQAVTKPYRAAPPPRVEPVEVWDDF